MLLDAVLADPDRTWLATEQDKLRYFTLTHRIPRRDLPTLTFYNNDAATSRYFPEVVMLHAILGARVLLAMVFAACVGTWELHVYPVQTGNAFLRLIQLKRPFVFDKLYRARRYGREPIGG